MDGRVAGAWKSLLFCFLPQCCCLPWPLRLWVATDFRCGSINWQPGRPALPHVERNWFRARQYLLQGRNIVARHQSAIDRRALITGQLLNPDRVVAPPGGEIASILVQARPERLASVESAIVALAGCEIYGRDPKGKLVVVVDAPHAGALGTTLNTIALLPDVYTASLVFHAIEVS
jgi:periplasmic nitrate reductase NapD